MLIQKLREHFPARLPEWSNALTMFAWGAYILLHPGIFNDPVFNGLIQLGGGSAPIAERSWGLLTVCVGMLRATALFVNGAHTRTPIVRVFASAVSAFVWAQVVCGLLMLDKPTTGVVMYSSALLLDLISAYRASWDAVIAETKRRSVTGSEKRGKSDSYPHPELV